MLKKFCKEYSYLVAVLLLLNLAGVVIIFIGAFINVQVIVRCSLLILGIVCLVGSTATWVISIYEFEKVEMQIKFKEKLVEDERS